MKTKKVVKVKGIGTEEFLKLLDNLDVEPILKRQVRKVKWLYENSNKHTMVYCEKDVRVVISRLQKRIKELESVDKIEVPESPAHENVADIDYIKDLINFQDYKVSTPVISEPSDELKTMVWEALGEASMCWNPKPSSQVFDDKEMLKVGDALIEKITRLFPFKDKSKDGGEELVEALNALVRLKDYKDKNGKDEHYILAQPIVWEKANKALSTYRKLSGEQTK